MSSSSLNLQHHDAFYIVLHSEDNNASNFIVSWENPIQLDPNSKWDVAMTELSYIYKPISIASNSHAIRYTYLNETSRIVHDLEIQTYSDSTTTIGFAKASTEQPIIYVFTFNLDEIIFVCDQPFKLEMPTDQCLGFRRDNIVAKKRRLITTTTFKAISEYLNYRLIIVHKGIHHYIDFHS